MGVFDLEDKITPKYLHDKYSASLDKGSIYRIKMYAVVQGTNVWFCKSEITINIDRDSLFIICPDKSGKIKRQWCNVTRMKHDIHNVSDLDFIIRHYSDILIDYAVMISCNCPIDICFGDEHIRWF